MTARGVSIAMVAAWLATSVHEAHVPPQPLDRYEASRMSMACQYAIDAYGRDADALPRIVNDAFDEVDHIDRLMLKDRALSVAGSSEKAFEAGGVRYSHIMDPRTGRPVQGVLSVEVLTSSGTAGDALDDAFFVLGPERSRAYVNRLHGTEAMFFLPASARLKSERASAGWTVVRQRAPE
jgi:thiamine biosynthesis lipoprotein ApbE